MHGNVHEWTADWNAEYTSAPQTDPEGPQSGTHRIMRGGARIHRSHTLPHSKI